MARTTYTFYYLYDPTQEEHGYVGMTTEPIQKKIRRHIQEATEEQHSPDSEKNKWIRDLLDKGLKPRCTELEITAYKDALQAAQRRIYWLNKMKEEGKALTNMTDGGLGTPGLHFEHTEETKEKIGEAATKFGDPALEKAIEMRREGKTYKEIYETLGMGRTNFYKDYKDKVVEALK
jgi:hypothetical protein